MMKTMMTSGLKVLGAVLLAAAVSLLFLALAYSLPTLLVSVSWNG